MVSANRAIYYFIVAILLIVLPLGAAADEASPLTPGLSHRQHPH